MARLRLWRTDDVPLIRTLADIDEAYRSGQVGLVFGLEAATPIENEIDRLDVLYGLGLRQIGIAYSDANSLGSGLAAPQIGVSQRVFVFDVDGVRGHLVNPGLEFPDEEEQDGPEGCLSFPGLYYDVKRRQNVVAQGFTGHGDRATGT